MIDQLHGTLEMKILVMHNLTSSLKVCHKNDIVYILMLDDVSIMVNLTI